MEIAANRRPFIRAALLLAVLACPQAIAWAQEPSVPPQSVTSLGDSLKRAQFKQLHIFYVHGMAADGPGYSESRVLRKSICQRLKDCTSPEGQFSGREYANQQYFALDSPPPNLSYFGDQIWKSRKSGPPSEGWNASAPFVDHWKFVRRGNAPTIYLDEINWWPLVFAVKCREIIAKDTELVGPSPAFLNKCSRLEADPKTPGRFLSYPWIEEDDARRLKDLPPRGALINRSVKNAVLDWGFTDAVLAVGSMRSYLLEGIRQLVLKSVNVAADGGREGVPGPLPNQEFVIVTHSLGSYLIFSALDLSPAQPEPAQDWKLFEKVLAQTSSVYFLANQLRLLELANLDVSPAQNMLKDLESWGRLRRQYQSGLAAPSPNDLLPPQIVAWSDPSDLLSWSVPDLSAVVVRNLIVKNATHWFWLIENPAAAHANYATNHRVITTMLKPTKPPQ
ncbi:MAG TPA: hypothetical protein VEU52_08940 [Candidatus Limnocylindrales bacterium]|nr:hypothetical protein [Candidatus Limnocylindrales bacterium]